MPPSNTNTEIALLKQETQYIKEWVARLEKTQIEQHTLLYNMMKELKDSLPETFKNFATKEDHETNSKRIEELENDKKAIIKWIILSFVWIILAWAWITKTFL